MDDDQITETEEKFEKYITDDDKKNHNILILINELRF